MSAFLTLPELAELTGRRQRAKQMAWLRENRWRFTCDANGRILVARAYWHRKLVGADADRIEVARVEPNFSGV